MKGWFSGIRLGLLGKIVIVLVAVGLIPLSVAAWQLIGLNRRAFQDQVLSLHALASKTTADRVSSFVAVRTDLTESLANNPSLYVDPNSEVARNLLTDLISSGGGIDVLTVALFNPDGSEVIRAQRRDMAGLTERLLSGQDKPGLRLIESAERRWLTVCTALPEESGLLVTAFAADSLTSMLEPVELGDEAGLILGDVEQGLLAGSEGVEELPDALMTRARSARLSGSGRFELPNGTTVLGAHAPLVAAPWYIVTWQPVSVAERISNDMRQQSLIAVGVALLLVALLAVAAYFGLVKPIRELITGQMRLAGMGSEWQGGDEISQLKESFAILEKHVGDRGELESVYLGRYRVDEKVGEGAMGTVYRGWDPNLQRPVALKTIRLDRVGKGDQPIDLVEQLINEAVTAGKVHHTNVVGVYDVAEANGFAFVAMEFVDGVSLDKTLAFETFLPLETVVYLVKHIAEGLKAAHHEGILHRDIKPGNIMINRGMTVKVADFGISKLVTNLNTDSKTVFGTPGYLPPEVLGGGEYLPSGDLFAIGVLMYRSLTGHLPFNGKSSREVILDTMLNHPPVPSKYNAKIPKELDDLVMDLLAKKPSERIPSADVLLQRLEALPIEPRWIDAGYTEGESGDVETIPDAMHSGLFETIDIDMLGGEGPLP